MEKPFQPYTVREHCLRNNEIDRSKQLQPLIEALKQEKRYPVSHAGLLRVEPTPRKKIASLHSVSLEAPIKVWSGEPPQLVCCDLLAVRKLKLITPAKGLVSKLRNKLYPIEESKLDALFTENEVPALVALLLDRFPDVTRVWTSEYPIPIRETINNNYGCQWGGHLRMMQLWDHGPFDFGTTGLNIYFDALDYPSETQDELPPPAVQPAGENISWDCPIDENGEELPF